MRIAENLRQYGWTEDEVSRAMEIMHPIKRQGELHPKTANALIYWVGLLVAIAANFLVALGIIPMLWVLDDFWGGLMIIIVGACLGLFIDWILRDIELIDPKHHVIAGLFLPCLALIVMFVVVQLSNRAASITGSSIFVEHNLILIPALYMIAFIAPYLITMRKRFGE